MARRHSGTSRAASASGILNTVYAFREARVLLTAYELDLFSVLAGAARSSDEVARAIGTNRRGTDRLMNALCAMKLLVKRKERYSNSPLAARFLVKGKTHYLAGLMHSVNLWDTWSTLTDAVRNGSRTLVRGSINDRSAHWLDSFIAAMHARTVVQGPVVARLLDLKRVHRILDVGGGSAGFSMAFVRVRKGISAVVFDLPNVLPLTKQYVDRENLGDRIEMMPGDYNVDSFGSGYDLVFLSAIIHSNSREVNEILCRKAFDALNPGGRLVVVDYMMREDRTAPAAGALFALNMLVGTEEGDTYTENEVKSWMEKGGLQRVLRKKTPFGTDMMIGWKI